MVCLLPASFRAVTSFLAARASPINMALVLTALPFKGHDVGRDAPTPRRHVQQQARYV